MITGWRLETNCGAQTTSTPRARDGLSGILPRIRCAVRYYRPFHLRCAVVRSLARRRAFNTVVY